MPLTAQPAAPTSRHARGRRERRALRVVALTALAAMTFTGTAALTFVVRLDDNIHHLDLDPLLGPRPTAAAQAQDPAEGRALTLLLLGSDSRAGKNGTIGGTVADSMRSDTTIVLHVSADRSRVELVSIPRDSMVAIPQCTTTSGETIAASEYSRFNKAFALGWDHGQDLESAAACAWRTVEATTGVLVDDFLLVDFVGFRDMVDAVDGVWICVPRDMDDRKAKLHVKAGYQRFTGPTALAFARSRGFQGNYGMDTGRIGNQQRLLAALADKALSSEVLTDLPALMRLLDAVTRSLTTSMSTTDLAGLARSLRDVRTGDVTFLTIPTLPDPRDPDNTLVWADDAATVWANLARDAPALTGTAQDPQTRDEPGTSATSRPTGPAGSSGTARPSHGSTKKAGREAFTLDDETASC
ncbi:LCP family protein [Cellulomonas gelida]|uniref:LCP family protein n=1 Tax=Cellulomonas gelida TaxID=1712 RepID=UPI002100524D|nr:LCP family protein [Cellulomonas gelida]